MLVPHEVVDTLEAHPILTPDQIDLDDID